jgi:hypothetical protein
MNSRGIMPFGKTKQPSSKEELTDKDFNKGEKEVKFAINT